MKITKIAKNPDPQKIYHVWHVCEKCGDTWTHSQADWEIMKKHKHEGYIVAIPIDRPEHPIYQKEN